MFDNQFVMSNVHETNFIFSLGHFKYNLRVPINTHKQQ
jgi:hypothetical protein